MAKRLIEELPAYKRILEGSIAEESALIEDEVPVDREYVFPMKSVYNGNVNNPLKKYRSAHILKLNNI